MGKSTVTIPDVGGVRNMIAYVTATDSVTVTGSTFTVSTPSVGIFVGTSSHPSGKVRFSTLNVSAYSATSILGQYKVWYYSTNTNYAIRQSQTIYIPFTSGGGSFTTSNFFNSSNKLSKTVSIPYTLNLNGVYNPDDDGTGSSHNTGINGASLGNLTTVTLNVPPTFDVGNISFTENGVATNNIYSGLTRATVTVSNLTAYYGGDISSAVFKIGNQTATRTDNGDLYIDLAESGSFSPTLTVRDSRGQVKTHTFPNITVLAYSPPSVQFNVERTLPKTGTATPIGKPDDEGESATISATFTYTSSYATLQSPTVKITDRNGNETTASVTWYSSRTNAGTVSGSVNWASLASGTEVYGVIAYSSYLFNTEYSYDISITPIDSKKTGTKITQTLGGAFYTVDFLAGGHGIAFGQPASQQGFYCNMDAHFVDKANIMRALFDFVYPKYSYYETSLSPTAPSGSQTPTSADLALLGDTWFNPNYAWGGTWILETAGLVHVSAGTGYAVSGANSASGAGAKDGGNKDAIVPYHNHGFTNPTIASSGAHVHTLNQRNAGTSGSRATNNVTYGASGHDYQTSNAFVSSGAHSHSYSASGSVGYAGTSGNTTNANMQPYINVYRWHRTA